jgi:hypothetical protein
MLYPGANPPPHSSVDLSKDRAVSLLVTIAAPNCRQTSSERSCIFPPVSFLIYLSSLHQYLCLHHASHGPIHWFSDQFSASKCDLRSIHSRFTRSCFLGLVFHQYPEVLQRTFGTSQWQLNCEYGSPLSIAAEVASGLVSGGAPGPFPSAWHHLMLMRSRLRS